MLATLVALAALCSPPDAVVTSASSLLVEASSPSPLAAPSSPSPLVAPSSPSPLVAPSASPTIAGPAATRTVAVHVRISGSIEATLSRTLPKEASALGAQIARLLRWKGDIVRNIQPKDELHLIYEPGSAPELVALRYAGSEVSLLAVRYTASDGVARFYDGDGVLVEPALDNPPLASYTQITEVVQHGRGKRKHAGLDFKAPLGTPVHLPFAAKIARVNWSRRVNGNCVEATLADGTLVRFLHLATVDASMVRGAELAAGAPVGTVGSTGHSSAAHLHYELRDTAGQPLDPMKVHGTHVGRVPSEEMPAFLQIRTRAETALLPPSA